MNNGIRQFWRQQPYGYCDDIRKLKNDVHDEYNVKNNTKKMFNDFRTITRNVWRIKIFLLSVVYMLVINE